jgi:hypothetical protein
VALPREALDAWDKIQQGVHACYPESELLQMRLGLFGRRWVTQPSC